MFVIMGILKKNQSWLAVGFMVSGERERDVERRHAEFPRSVLLRSGSATAAGVTGAGAF